MLFCVFQATTLKLRHHEPLIIEPTVLMEKQAREQPKDNIRQRFRINLLFPAYPLQNKRPVIITTSRSLVKVNAMYNDDHSDDTQARC